MRTTINLPAELIREAQKAAGVRTKTETIILGLKLVLRRRQNEDLLALRGKVSLRVDLNKSRQR
jgi:Arc/MetJ family transcription regulator